MTEETRPHPEDSYGIAKLAVEHELRACQEMFGLDYVIFRPHNVYGERQNIGDQVPQRRRHLHEPDPAGPADDGLRRRHADARLQLHRRRRAAHGRGDRRSRRAEPDLQRRRGRAVHVERPGASGRGRNGCEPQMSSTWRRGTRCSTRIQRTRRSGACSARGRTRRSRTGSRGWQPGCRRHGARHSAPFNGIEIRRICRRCGSRDDRRTTPHI